jgi:hypothetical protein
MDFVQNCVHYINVRTIVTVITTQSNYIFSKKYLYLPDKAINIHICC